MRLARSFPWILLAALAARPALAQTTGRPASPLDREPNPALAAPAAAWDEARQAWQRTRAEVRAGDDAIRTRAASHSSWGILPLPSVFAAPENGVGVGLAAIAFWHNGPPDLVRTSIVSLFANYTSRQQGRIGLSSTLWFARNTLALFSSVGYEYYPQPFFGIGNDTLAKDGESYVARRLSGSVYPAVQVLPHTYLGAKLHADKTDVLDVVPGGLLDGPRLEGLAGGWTVSAGPQFLFDNRDNANAASRGTVFEAGLSVFSKAFGSDYAFSAAVIDVRHYVPLGNQVLAFGLLARTADGRVPFYGLSDIGGSALRGVFKGLYRELNSVQGQVELRFPIFGRFGGAFFVGAGEVFRSYEDFAPAKLHAAGGAGLRYDVVPRERLRIRLDFAYSASIIPAYYLSLGEAF